MVNCLALAGPVRCLLRWDTDFFYLINGRTQNALFDLIMPVLSDFHLWRWPILAAAVAVIIFGRRRARITVLVVLVAVALSDQLSSGLLKPLISRPRPSHVLEGVRLLGGRGGRYGFPSSHAANVFSAWIVLALRHPRLKYALVVIPVAVAYSRVYVGVHYPLDVIGGALLGLAVGLGLVGLTELTRGREKR
jgi:undecaprenyl-diphosphatase